MTTESMSKNDIENRISALRKRIDLSMAVGAGDEVNKLRDEIGSLYKILMTNERESSTKERIDHEQ